jgi:hypothetical protein
MAQALRSFAIRMRNVTALTALALSLGLVAIAPAQQAFSQIGQYSQFRNISGLPGGTFGVNPDGSPGISGAMGLSTPIAYSLGGGHFAGAIANTSYDGQFRFLTKAKKNDFGVKSNGTATGMAGISTPLGKFTLGMSVASGAFENSYSALFTPKQNNGKITLAFGAEGLFAAGGFIGPGLHSDVDRATSAFIVATADLGHGLYASAGTGTARFDKGFVNASYGIGGRFRAVVEHDGFGWNYGVGAEVAKIRIGKGAIRLNTFAGMVQSRYAFWSAGFSF